MKNKIDSSRQKTPWDNSDKHTVTQKFIGEVYRDNYKNKHLKLLDTKEENIINSIILGKCKICNSSNIIKHGLKNNRIQRYYCKQCRKTFTPTTGTIFENHKISITEWIEFLLDIFNYGSTTLIPKVIKIVLIPQIIGYIKCF